MRLCRLFRAVAFAFLMFCPVTPLTIVPTAVAAQSAEGGMCLEFSNDGAGFSNTCAYDMSIQWCIINPDFPRVQEGKYYYGQPNCGKEESTGTRLRAGESRRENSRSLFLGRGVVWLECRPSNGMITFNSMETGRLIVGSRPHFQPTCMRADDQIVPGFTATRQLSADPKFGNSGSALQGAAAARQETEADARFAAEQLEYEQKLAVQQKAVADFEAAQRQMEADKAAAAAKANAAQLEFARQQAEYEAQLAGRTVEAGAAGSSAPTTSLSASAESVAARNEAARLANSDSGGSHTPPLPPLSSGGQTPPWVQQGNDSRIIARDGRVATDCVKLVNLSTGDSTTTGLGGRVLSNQCEGPVTVGWCYVGGECERDSGNMATIQANYSWPVSAEKDIRWGACHGANTIHGEPGSSGLRFTCSKPNI